LGATSTEVASLESRRDSSNRIGSDASSDSFSETGPRLLLAIVLRRTAAWHALTTRNLSRSETRRLALMGGVSLVSWLTAVGAGRIIGYW
jgi:hypothetical protein